MGNVLTAAMILPNIDDVMIANKKIRRRIIWMSIALDIRF